MKKFFVFMFILIFCLSGCTNEENLTIENKINSEIEYVKKNCSIFIAKFDSDEYLKDGTLDSEKIKYDTTVFLNSLPVIVDDLKYVKLSDEFINNMNNIIGNINNFSQNNQLDNLKNEYISLYNLFEALEK